MPLQQTSGNNTVDAYGGGAAVINYIEDVFSTWLYTGTGAAQTITNGIDLSGKGGLVWMKGRSGATDHALYDTARGATFDLVSNSTSAQTTQATGLTSFGSTGFSIGALAKLNTSAATYASWTFRKQPKFFDVVTYTGTSANRTIAHNLGSVPGCIMVKRTDTTGDWQVYHSSLANTQYTVLNTTAAAATGATRWNSTTPTSTVFSLGTDTTVNASGGTYVAYLFAHNAGGFGLTGTDNVISCGSFTTDGNGTIPATTLGYEPQYVMFKPSSSTGSWTINDTMRGQPTPSTSNASAPDATLYAQNTNAESQADNLYPTSTGFKGVFAAVIPSTTYIYIAIRRGPMKVPTNGTSVFSPLAFNNAQGTQNTTGFSVDSQWINYRPGTAINTAFNDRLRGVSSTTTSTGRYLVSSSTAVEATINSTTQSWNNTGFQTSVYFAVSNSVYYNFQRAPSFFDEVCYTGTGANTTITHNLQAVPELMIVKSRSAIGNWAVYSSATGNGNTLLLQTNNAAFANANWNSTTPTSTVFSIGVTSAVNTSGTTYVSYLFATCPGVSKVGSYTGNGSTQTINCGFTGGARFVLIKRTDSTGDWYVYDTARGMSTLTDPYLLLNSTAAESATLGSVTTVTTGFAVNAAILAAINTNAATYIFLAVA